MHNWLIAKLISHVFLLSESLPSWERFMTLSTSFSNNAWSAFHWGQGNLKQSLGTPYIGFRWLHYLVQNNVGTRFPFFFFFWVKSLIQSKSGIDHFSNQTQITSSNGCQNHKPFYLDWAAHKLSFSIDACQRVSLHSNTILLTLHFLI